MAPKLDIFNYKITLCLFIDILRQTVPHCVPLLTSSKRRTRVEINDIDFITIIVSYTVTVVISSRCQSLNIQQFLQKFNKLTRYFHFSQLKE